MLDAGRAGGAPVLPDSHAPLAAQDEDFFEDEGEEDESEYKRQEVEEAEGTETEYGPDFDRVPDATHPGDDGVEGPNDVGDEEEFGDKQALSLLQVFHRVTGQVVEEGLNENQSNSAIAHAYTHCVALYQHGLYQRGRENYAKIPKSGILEYTLTTLTMTRIIAQKKERYRLKHQELMAEVLQEHSALRQFYLDGRPLPEGIALRRAPGVLPDETEQLCREKEQSECTQISLRSSAHDAAALIQADKYCPLYQHVMEDQKARSGDMEKKRVETTENIVKVPLRQETPPVRTAKPVLKKPVPTERITSVPPRQEESPVRKAKPVSKRLVPKIPAGRKAPRWQWGPPVAIKEKRVEAAIPGVRPLVSQTPVRKAPLANEMPLPILADLESTPLGGQNSNYAV